MSAELKLTTRNTLRDLRPGPFRRYIIGSAISDTGTWMQVMTQGWVLATLTTSASMLGLVNLCAGLPMVALTKVDGSAADKFDRLKILIMAILSLPARRRGTAEEEEKRTTGIKEGFRYVAKDKPSLAMVTLIATQAVCIFPIITVMMPLYVRLVLGLGADKLGTLMGASAVGSVVGSLFLIGLPREKRVPLMMMCATAVTCAVLGLSRAAGCDFAT